MQKKLDKKKLEYYKKLLLQHKFELLNDIHSLNKESGEGESKDVSGHVLHMADVASDMYDKEFSMNLASKDRVILQRIDNALKRIEDGTYGFCIATGKPIKADRLEAIPYAEHCLEYQEQQDKKRV